MADQNNSSNENLIQDIVDSAMNSMNFERINQDVSKSVASVFEELGIQSVKISDHIKEQGLGGTSERTISSRIRGNYAGQTASGEAAGNNVRQRASGQSGQSSVATRNPKGSLVGIIMTALGATCTAIFGLSEFVVIVLTLTLEQLKTAGVVSAVVLLPFLLLSIYTLIYGVKTNGRIKRFKNYLRTIGQRKFCQITELASGIGKPAKYVADDLQDMIERKYFTNAHIDTLKTTLMLDEETYQQYLRSVEQYQQRVSQEQSKDSIFSSAGLDADSELAQTLEEGRKYIQQVRQANDAIPGEAFSAKLDKMEELIRKIFEVVKKKPDQIHKLRKFMKYYMPTTIKLLQAYQELDNQTTSGENIQNSKKEIEDTVDTINYAYEKLLDTFFEESAMDISTDISVLENMFAQEGLSKDPFDDTKYMQAQAMQMKDGGN